MTSTPPAATTPTKPDKRTSLKAELKKLVDEGEMIYIAMLKEQDLLGKETLEQLEKRKIEVPKFHDRYEPWYSLAQQVVKQILPDRLGDFDEQYKMPKRKAITYATYVIADYLINLVMRDGFGAVAVGASAAVRKMRIQVDILKAANESFGNRLRDLTQVIQADLFDSELDAARDLCKKGHCRAAGAVAGVVLEGHLAHVCSVHSIAIGKKHPTINDYNQALKDNSVIDVPQWRFVQHLADIRNLCDHAKGVEPTKEQITDLIAGVDKTTKTMF